MLGDHLYYLNALKGLVCRVQIDLFTRKAVGKYEIISTGISGADDFTISEEEFFVAVSVQNSLERIHFNGSRSSVAGGLNSTLIPGPTSASFGRARGDRHIIYVTTGGDQVAPVNGIFTECGKVVAIPVA